jgi:hypothetical protein
MIRLASDPRVHQVINIIVVDIPESYGLLLSRDWSAKLQGYFSTDWSHLWLPYKGKPNQIQVNNEAHMKHTVIELKGKNEPVSFAHTVLGNYFLETDHGCYEVRPSPIQTYTQSELLQCTQTDDNDCTILKTHGFCITNSNLHNNMWTMFFDGSRS